MVDPRWFCGVFFVGPWYLYVALAVGPWSVHEGSVMLPLLVHGGSVKGPWCFHDGFMLGASLVNGGPIHGDSMVASWWALWFPPGRHVAFMTPWWVHDAPIARPWRLCGELLVSPPGVIPPCYFGEVCSRKVNTPSQTWDCSKSDLEPKTTRYVFPSSPCGRPLAASSFSEGMF